MDPFQSLGQLFKELKQEDQNLDMIFGTIYHQLSPGLRSYFLAKKIGVSEAEDLVQQTLIQLFEKRSHYREDQEALAWVYVQARSLFIDWYRKQKREGRKKELWAEQVRGSGLQASESAESQMPFGSQMSSEDLILLGDLTPDEQQLLEDRFILGFTFAELSVKWGVSIQALRKRVSRLYARLAKQKERVYGSK